MKNSTEPIPVKYIVIFFAVTALVIIGIIALFYNVNSVGQSGDPATNTHIDPDSGETVSNPTDKGPEKFGVNPDAPIYLGFSNMYTSGLSQNQVESIKSSLASYTDSIKAKQKVTQISLRKNSITHVVDGEQDINLYTFILVMNEKDVYQVKATPSSDSIDEINFTLYKDDKLVFTSPKV
jgi:hypothetical protein